MLKGMKLRLYPTRKQEQQLIIMFGNDRFLWNILLAGINQRYKNNGYTLSGMDRDSMPDFFIQKRGHLLSPRYTINSPQKS